MNTNKCAVIVSGGTLEEEFLKEQLKLKAGSILIGVDRGVEFFYRHGIRPDFIVGDFDSLPEKIVNYYKEETGVPVREFDPVKDATDSEIALRLAMEQGCGRICLYGGTGTRLDHVLGNIQMLCIPLHAGIHAEILDPCNRIRLISGEEIIRKEEMYGPYFSVFPLGGEVPHFNITGAKYPLRDHTLSYRDSLCVSNQAEEEEVRITFPEGIVILMETRDNGWKTGK